MKTVKLTKVTSDTYTFKHGDNRWAVMYSDGLYKVTRNLEALAIAASLTHAVEIIAAAEELPIDQILATDFSLYDTLTKNTQVGNVYPLFSSPKSAKIAEGMPNYFAEVEKKNKQTQERLKAERSKHNKRLASQCTKRRK